MLAIPRTAPGSPEDFERLWAFAKHLYLSKELAEELWTSGGILTPVKEHWGDPIYDRPNAYFSGQAVGRAYIAMAPATPRRASSPFNTEAIRRTVEALRTLSEELRARPRMTEGELEGRAMELLAAAQAYVQSQIDRNVFLSEGAEGGGS